MMGSPVCWLPTFHQQTPCTDLLRKLVPVVFKWAFSFPLTIRLKVSSGPPLFGSNSIPWIDTVFSNIACLEALVRTPHVSNLSSQRLSSWTSCAIIPTLMKSKNRPCMAQQAGNRSCAKALARCFHEQLLAFDTVPVPISLGDEHQHNLSQAFVGKKTRKRLSPLVPEFKLVTTLVGPTSSMPLQKLPCAWSRLTTLSLTLSSQSCRQALAFSDPIVLQGVKANLR